VINWRSISAADLTVTVAGASYTVPADRPAPVDNASNCETTGGGVDGANTIPAGTLGGPTGGITCCAGLCGDGASSRGVFTTIGDSTVPCVGGDCAESCVGASKATLAADADASRKLLKRIIVGPTPGSFQRSTEFGKVGWLARHPENRNDRGGLALDFGALTRRM
jgi:hypothetical protein